MLFYESLPVFPQKFTLFWYFPFKVRKPKWFTVFVNRFASMYSCHSYFIESSFACVRNIFGYRVQSSVSLLVFFLIHTLIAVNTQTRSIYSYCWSEYDASCVQFWNISNENTLVLCILAEWEAMPFIYNVYTQVVDEKTQWKDCLNVEKKYRKEAKKVYV